MRCSRCNSVMFGVSGNARGKKVAYYACRKRLATKDCDQDYVRADKIEEKILSDIQAIFQDEALLTEVWEAAQAKLTATRPGIDTEIEATQKQRQKSQAALQRYFTAFEAGTMDPTTCNERVAELTTQIRQLDEKLLDLNREREELDLPALQTEFIQEILTNLHGVVEAVPPAQKKHLLQLLVEKVLIKDKCTFSVWYRLPQFPEGVRTLSLLVAPRGLEPLLPP
ncbi:MAG: recombinase zinc beta ribbon domain-containing protein [Bacteroidales bacterium]|nr:recombinase zinc beta ribbon domain-containing protein [Candidatus Latescibacterota bacterium]